MTVLVWDREGFGGSRFSSRRVSGGRSGPGAVPPAQ